jgi:Domain of unknown function (DUF5667)
MSPENLDQRLEDSRPVLSQAEQAELWQRIASQVNTPTSVPSPYTFISFIHSRTMTSLIVALVVILGAGSTVAVSEAAKPGDLLFPIERATERARLAFATDERAAELRTTFATERLAELEAILAEEGALLAYNDTDSLSSSTGSILNFEAEADVFTDITVVKVEANDQTRVFTTAATSREAVVAEIAARYSIATDVIEAALDFEIEDRASRLAERGRVTVDDRGEERVSTAINELLNLLEDVDDESSRNDLLSALLTQIDTVSVRGREDKGNDDNNRIDVRAEDSRLRIDDDRVEIREDGYRIRIDNDGEVRIKTDDDSSDSVDQIDSWDDSDFRDEDSDDSSGRGRDDDSSDDSPDAWDDSDSRVEDEDDDRDDSSGHGRGGDDDREDDEDEDDDRDEDEDDDEDNSGSGKDRDKDRDED